MFESHLMQSFEKSARWSRGYSPSQRRRVMLSLGGGKDGPYLGGATGSQAPDKFAEGRRQQLNNARGMYVRGKKAGGEEGSAARQEAMRQFRAFAANRVLRQRGLVKKARYGTAGSSKQRRTTAMVNRANNERGYAAAGGPRSFPAQEYVNPKNLAGAKGSQAPDSKGLKRAANMAAFRARVRHFKNDPPNRNSLLTGTELAGIRAMNRSRFPKSSVKKALGRGKGLAPKGGSSAWAAAFEGKKGPRAAKAREYAAGRVKWGYGNDFHDVREKDRGDPRFRRLGVYKGRGLMPKGGTSQMLRRVTGGKKDPYEFGRGLGDNYWRASNLRSGLLRRKPAEGGPGTFGRNKVEFGTGSRGQDTVRVTPNVRRGVYKAGMIRGGSSAKRDHFAGLAERERANPTMTNGKPVRFGRLAGAAHYLAQREKGGLGPNGKRTGVYKARYGEFSSAGRRGLAVSDRLGRMGMRFPLTKPKPRNLGGASGSQAPDKAAASRARDVGYHRRDALANPGEKLAGRYLAELRARKKVQKANRMNWMDSRGRRNPTGAFLTDVSHEGRSYTITGKVGRNIKTGKRVAEYRNKSGGLDRRVWADVRGNKYPD